MKREVRSQKSEVRNKESKDRFSVLCLLSSVFCLLLTAYSLLPSETWASQNYLQNLKVYKNPDEFCCLFALIGDFSGFVFVPYPED